MVEKFPFLLVVFGLRSCASFSPHDNACRSKSLSFSRGRSSWKRTTKSECFAQSSDKHKEAAHQKEEIKMIEGNKMFTGEIFSSQKCWGKEPLLIKNAFDANLLLEKDDDGSLAPWPSWNTVLEISREEWLSPPLTRVVEHKPNDLTSFTVEIGPPSTTKNNDGTRWTLVMNDVERYYTPLSDWMNEIFAFLPNWRRDDGQVSLAKKGGGIGPHVDNYDVFLIQTSGVREWRVGTKRLDSVEEEMGLLAPQSEVRILSDWPNRENIPLVLEPGDMLYLPPRVVHCGTATTDDCITLSVGCRTPSASQLVSRVAEHISQSLSHLATRHYQDHNGHDDAIMDKGGVLDDRVKSVMKEMVSGAVQEVLDNDSLWDSIVGKVVTESNRPSDNYPAPLAEEEEAGEDVWGHAETAMQEIQKGSGGLYRSEGITFAYSHNRIYANGQEFVIPDERTRLVVMSMVDGASSRIDPQVLQECIQHVPTQQLLKQLLQEGLLYGSDEQ